MKVEDDPVVKEINVFLSKTLANQLYIIQYPFYHKNYDSATAYKVSVKPKNQKLRMEFVTDTENTESYDRSMGEQLALNAENGENGKMFSSGLMDKIVLASGGTLPQKSNYAVGIFQDGQLHITPLKNIMHMRMQYDYLDENDKRMKEGTKHSEDDDEDEDNPSPVKVTFAKHLPENIKKKQEQSFRHHAKKTQEEHWIHTSYISPYDAQAELTRMQMFSQSEFRNAFNLEPVQYMQRLMPQVPEDYYSRNIPEDQFDLHRILTMPLLDQIRIIMKRVQIISFARLRQMISSEHDATLILKYLQQVAVLVQGNWVVNSELIYPKDPQNAISELMCKARDYMLSLFTEQLFVHRNMLSSVIKLQPDEIDEIFAELATYVPEKGWQLKELPNWIFCDRHPDIVQRQEMYWDAKRKNLREILETRNQPPQRQRRKSHRESIGSENEERNVVVRGRKSLRDSSLSDNDSTTEPAKHKKSTRSRKVSETM